MYEELFVALRESTKPVTIRTNVSASAVRKGLQKVIKTHNQNAAILDLPIEERSPSISDNGDGSLTVQLVNETKSGRFDAKFSFEIVGDTDNDSS